MPTAATFCMDEGYSKKNNLINLKKSSWKPRLKIWWWSTLQSWSRPVLPAKTICNCYL